MTYVCVSSNLSLKHKQKIPSLLCVSSTFLSEKRNCDPRKQGKPNQNGGKVESADPGWDHLPSTTFLPSRRPHGIVQTTVWWSHASRDWLFPVGWKNGLTVSPPLSAGVPAHQDRPRPSFSTPRGAKPPQPILPLVNLKMRSPAIGWSECGPAGGLLSVTAIRQLDPLLIDWLSPSHCSTPQRLVDFSPAMQAMRLLAD